MQPLRGFLLLALVAGALVTTGHLLADDDDDDDELRALPAVTQPQWKAECGSCHMLYHPALLPERSWRKLMAGLDDHFGENAALDDTTRKTITDFLAQHAADRTTARRGTVLGRGIPADQVPTRITGTRSFRGWHDELSPATFKRASVGSAANCVACHRGAERGDFSEHKVRIPR
ncbi:MAG: diheme cytochrome c [Myxococcota bacterium]